MSNASTLLLAAEAFRLIDEIKVDLQGVNQKVMRVKEIIGILRGLDREQPKRETLASMSSPTQNETNSSPSQTSSTSQPMQSQDQSSPAQQTPMTTNNPNVTELLEANLAEQEEIKKMMRKYNRKLTWGIPSPVGGSLRVLAYGGLAALVFSATTIWPLAAMVAGGLALLNVKFKQKRNREKLNQLTRENNALLRQAGEYWEQLNDPSYQQERERLKTKNPYYQAAIENEEKMLQKRLNQSKLDGPQNNGLLSKIRGDRSYIRTI